MIIPICIGSPIILSVLKSFKLCVDLSTIGSAAPLLCVIITYTVKIKPWKCIKACPGLKDLVHTYRLSIQGAGNIVESRRKGLPVKEFLTSCYRSTNNRNQKQDEENFIRFFHILNFLINVRKSHSIQK